MIGYDTVSQGNFLEQDKSSEQLNMRTIYLVVLLLIGVILTVIGALFKIMHWPGASLALILGASIKVLAIILLIVKLVNSDREKAQ